MAYKALGGFLTGTALAVVGAGVVSVATMPGLPKPDAAASAPESTAVTPSSDAGAIDVTGSDPIETVMPGTSEPTAPQSDDIVQSDTSSAAKPAADMTDTAMKAPEASENEPTIAMADKPVTVGNVATAPAQPAPETAPEALAPSTLAPVPVPDEPALADAPTVGDAPVVSEALAEDSTPSNTADAPRDIAAAPAPETSADAAPEPDRVPAQIVALPRQAEPDARTALPRIGQDTQTEEPAVATGPTIGKPAVRLTDRASDTPETEAAPTPDPEPVSPLVANSESFENPEQKPLMSIVLIDSGDSPIGLETLANFPIPVSMAVDPFSPTGQTRMQAYRDAGFEVLALTDLPLGSTANDTETLMRAALRELPGVVGVMEGVQTGLQSDKAISDQTTAILRETGHGLLMFPKGLNTAQKLALKEGVPSVTVFRDFDSKGQNASVIRRFLDQAAFKSRQQEDGVVMVGRLQAETISALLLWGLQDRASRVALAPVSAVLKATQP